MVPSIAESTEVIVLKRDGAGALDEDAYCIQCGYNLRGLSGEPIVCPECGHPNELGVIAVPAELIRKALANMESNPTWATGLAFAFCTFLPVAWVVDASLVVMTIVALPPLWLYAARRMKQSYRDEPGWKTILAEFHIALALMTFFLLGTQWVVVARSHLEFNVGAGVLITLLLSPFLFAIGLRIYRRAQARIAIMQRAAAVQIAREELRKMLSRPR